MNVQSERRAPFTTRIAFDTPVEVGGTLGPTFEAKALDVSLAGMRLRTAYLPEIGQEVSCRFELGSTTVVCEGEVTWSREAAKGGEFGIAFTRLDEESGRALRAALEERLGAVPGERLRLHVEGLAQPLKARVSTARPRMITAKTDLAFLRLGSECDVERVDEGCNVHARVGDVSVSIDPKTRIPQLIVSMRTADTPTDHVAGEVVDHDETPAREPARSLRADGIAATSNAMQAHDDEPSEDDERVPDSAQEALASKASGRDTSSPRSNASPSSPRSNASASSPRSNASPSFDSDEAVDTAVENAAVSPMARAKTVFGPIALNAKQKVLLAWSKIQSMQSARVEESILEDKPKRVTAKAPGGGLHATGRKIVRQGISSRSDVSVETPVPSSVEPTGPLGAFKKHQRKVAIVSAIGLAAALAGIAFSKPAPEAPLAVAPAAVAPADPLLLPTGALPPPAAANTPLAANSPVPAPGRAIDPSVPAPTDPVAHVAVDSASEPAPALADDTPPADAKPLHVAPFLKGKVVHGKTLHLRMNAPIAKIAGTRTLTGFMVTLPGVKSMDPAAPLTKSDKRLAGAHMQNGADRSTLTIDFKDGVPDYAIRAKGDVLEITLAEPTEAEIAAAKSKASHPALEKASAKVTAKAKAVAKKSAKH